MDTKIQKWGNSLAVRIPKAYAEQIGLYSNSPVRISLEGERLVIEAARRATPASWRMSRPVTFTRRPIGVSRWEMRSGNARS
jgi:antitoxin component of MazEF toxin-antitoxin module